MVCRSLISLVILCTCILSLGHPLLPCALGGESPVIIEGYVYLDGVLAAPENVTVQFPGHSFLADILADGQYLLLISSVQAGLTGTFQVSLSGQWHAAAETLTTLESVSYYELSLHVTDSGAGQLPPDPTTPASNEAPQPHAGGPYLQYLDRAVQFNGTRSMDPDGQIVSYLWDLGDDTSASGATPTHLYGSEGNFTVTLTVTDNNGSLATATSYALVVSNLPPVIQTCTGPQHASTSSPYQLSVQATDPDNDILQFLVDWGDGSGLTATDFVASGTAVLVFHNWTTIGSYTIRVTANDRNTESDQATCSVLVNIAFLDDLGYLTDADGDGVYDQFYSNITKGTAPVKVSDGQMFLDTDGDGVYEYQYTGPEASQSKTASSSFPALPILVIALGLIVCLASILIIAPRMKRTHAVLQPRPPVPAPAPAKDGLYYLRQKPTATPPPPLDRHQAIQREVDLLLMRHESKVRKP